VDSVTHRTLKDLLTAFRRSWSEVLRHLLQWSLTHGQGWKLDDGPVPGPAHRIFLRIEPQVRQQVREAATASGGDVSA
jgi:hypothetical protein